MIFEKYSSTKDSAWPSSLTSSPNHFFRTNFFYSIEGYNNAGSNELFQIYEKLKCVRYIEENYNFWLCVKEYDYVSLNKLYILAKKHLIKAKEQKIKNKMNELEKDFEW